MNAALREGEIVLDLGAGGGFDCFIAAHAGRPPDAGDANRASSCRDRWAEI